MKIIGDAVLYISTDMLLVMIQKWIDDSGYQANAKVMGIRVSSKAGEGDYAVSLSQKAEVKKS